MFVHELGRIGVVREIDPVHLPHTRPAHDAPLAPADGHIASLDDFLVARKGVPLVSHEVRDVGHVGEVDRDIARSEEHTSELQSLMRISYAVFCLKKKKNIDSTIYKLQLYLQYQN